jgi:hypothetical protein
MSVFSYRMEHVMGELNYCTYLMTIWGVGWIAGSEHKAHGMLASLSAQPYISPPDYDTVESLSKKEIILAQQSAINEYGRYQQNQRDGSSRSTVFCRPDQQRITPAALSRCWWHEDDEQCTMDSRACSRAAATFVRGGTLPLCRT